MASLTCHVQVSFAFGLEVTWDLIQQRMAEDAVKAEQLAAARAAEAARRAEERLSNGGSDGDAENDGSDDDHSEEEPEEEPEEEQVQKHELEGKVEEEHGLDNVDGDANEPNNDEDESSSDTGGDIGTEPEEKANTDDSKATDSKFPAQNSETEIEQHIPRKTKRSASPAKVATPIQRRAKRLQSTIESSPSSVGGGEEENAIADEPPTAPAQFDTSANAGVADEDCWVCPT